MNSKVKLIAKPLIRLDKARKVMPGVIDGKTYLFITPKRYIGSGKDLESAIEDANCRTFMTGYQVVREEA